MFARQLILTATQLAAVTTTDGTGGGFFGPFVLAVVAVGFGVFAAVRFLAVLSAVLEGLVRAALTVGSTVLAVVFLAGILGVTWLSHSIDL